MEETFIELMLDERACRALNSAVSFTLEKWGGQGFMDQEMLLELKGHMQRIVLEFDLDK